MDTQLKLWYHFKILQMKTINSSLILKNVHEERTILLLKHLKKIEDIPYENMEIRDIKKSEKGMSLEVTFSYPLSVFDKTVTQFLTVLFGELSFMKEFGDLTFLKLDLPEEIYSWFLGPKFGAFSVAERFNVNNFPMLIAILKPSLGPLMTKKVAEEKISEILSAGFHGVKDDEMQGDLSYFPLKDRVHLAKKFMRYIPAINQDSIDIYKKHLTNKNIGMVILNGTVVGFPLLHEIRKITKVPLLSHVSLQGIFGKSFTPKLYAQLHRLFGCDALITPIGDAGYYRCSKIEEQEMVEELTKDLPIKKTLPLLTGGARINNLEHVIGPYRNSNIPYGVVFGTQVFFGEGTPYENVQNILQKIKTITSR